jgi:hypothetical protein
MWSSTQVNGNDAPGGSFLRRDNAHNASHHNTHAAMNGGGTGVEKTHMVLPADKAGYLLPVSLTAYVVKCRSCAQWIQKGVFSLSSNVMKQIVPFDFAAQALAPHQMSARDKKEFKPPTPIFLYDVATWEVHGVFVAMNMANPHLKQQGAGAAGASDWEVKRVFADDSNMVFKTKELLLDTSLEGFLSAKQSLLLLNHFYNGSNRFQAPGRPGALARAPPPGNLNTHYLRHTCSSYDECMALEKKVRVDSFAQVLKDWNLGDVDQSAFRHACESIHTDLHLCKRIWRQTFVQLRIMKSTHMNTHLPAVGYILNNLHQHPHWEYEWVLPPHQLMYKDIDICSGNLPRVEKGKPLNTPLENRAFGTEYPPTAVYRWRMIKDILDAIAVTINLIVAENYVIIPGYGTQRTRCRILHFFNKWVFSSLVLSPKGCRKEVNDPLLGCYANSEKLFMDIFRDIFKAKPQVDEVLDKIYAFVRTAAFHVMKVHRDVGARHGSKQEMDNTFTNRSSPHAISVQFSGNNSHDNVRLSWSGYIVRMKRSVFAKLVASHISTREETHHMHFRIFVLAYRYRTYSITNDDVEHSPLPHSMVEAMRSHFGVRNQCFATPFNRYAESYCSLFPDVDVYFGSKGGSSVLEGGEWNGNGANVFQKRGVHLLVWGGGRRGGASRGRHCHTDHHLTSCCFYAKL